MRLPGGSAVFDGERFARDALLGFFALLRMTIRTCGFVDRPV